MGSFRRFPLCLCPLLLVSSAIAQEWPVYESNPFRIPLAAEQRVSSRRGGIIVADLDGDGLLDFLLSTKENDRGPGRATLGAYRHDGEPLWVVAVDIALEGNSQYDGLPGWCGPGFTASDLDGDGAAEVVHLDTRGAVVVRDGRSGEVRKTIPVSLPEESAYSGAKGAFRTWLDGSAKKAFKHWRSPTRWSHLQIVNLAGDRDDEVILQADPLPFRWLKAVSLATGDTLWENSGYVGLQHGGFRAADIDGDGYDEVVGATVLDHDGSVVRNWKYRRFPGHFDALQIADIRPDVPGLEWVLVEEGQHGGDRTTVLGKERILFSHSHRGWEPQGIAVGDFDPAREGLEIWCRSRYESDQKPWVIDARGETIAAYRLADTKPEGWSAHGVDFMCSIDWTGGARALLAVRERREHRRFAVMDPLDGRFVRTWVEPAARLYVVDVAGDRREEIVVVDPVHHEIRVFSNEQESAGPDGERPWSRPEYRRSKRNYNYYSP